MSRDLSVFSLMEFWAEAEPGWGFPFQNVTGHFLIILTVTTCSPICTLAK
jgi:hypothetical protein